MSGRRALFVTVGAVVILAAIAASSSLGSPAQKKAASGTVVSRVGGPTPTS